MDVEFGAHGDVAKVNLGGVDGGALRNESAQVGIDGEEVGYPDLRSHVAENLFDFVADLDSLEVGEVVLERYAAGHVIAINGAAFLVDVGNGDGAVEHERLKRLRILVGNLQRVDKLLDGVGRHLECRGGSVFAAGECERAFENAVSGGRVGHCDDGPGSRLRCLLGNSRWLNREVGRTCDADGDILAEARGAHGELLGGRVGHECHERVVVNLGGRHAYSRVLGAAATFVGEKRRPVGGAADGVDKHCGRFFNRRAVLQDADAAGRAVGAGIVSP